MRFLPLILLVVLTACMKGDSRKESMTKNYSFTLDSTKPGSNVKSLPIDRDHATIVGKTRKLSSLKKAIELAKAGDIIILEAGVYREGNITITKPVTILGDGYPVLDGENKFETLTLSGTKIHISGLHFKNIGRSAMNDYAAIKVIDANNITIENNRITDAYFAIHISNAKNCVVRNNEIAGTPTTEQSTGNGIHLWKCENALIEKNFISGHRDGIYFEFVTNSTVSENISQGNIRYGIHFMFSHNDSYLGNTFRDNGAGVAVMYSKQVRMENNLFEKNWGASAYGILLKEISDSHIKHNTFFRNTVAILMEGTSRIEVMENMFEENGWAMKVQASCNENVFHDNNFLANSFDVATNGMMMLNRFYNNYWDKYEGYDLNKDGVGDVPYHPVSMYAMVVEQNPNALILLRSFMVSLLDKAEKAIPSLTPEDLKDEKPMIKPLEL